MRKTINIFTLLFLVWLVLDSFHVFDNLLDGIVSFLLVGALPGTTLTLSPTMMLAIMTTLSGIIIFELMARRFDIVRRIRYHFLNLSTKNARLPKRRFGRV